MPANNKDYVATYCIRGVRKLTPEVWAQYDAACNPDIITALSDTPFTSAPHSNKRTHKSLERSTAWLANLLHSVAARRREVGSDGEPLTGSLSNVLVHMAGGAVVQARKAFAEGLMEDLEEFKAVNPSPYRRLDDGVAGYVFDLVPLRAALSARSKAADEDLGDDADTLKPRGAINTLTPTSRADTSAVDPAALSEVLRASLQPLPTHKPRLVNSARSPHEMLRLVRDVGIDLFDAHWAQRAADIGVALDFAFPVALGGSAAGGRQSCGMPQDEAATTPTTLDWLTPSRLLAVRSPSPHQTAASAQPLISGCGELEGRSEPADNGGCSPYGDGYGCIAWLYLRALRMLSELAS
ncbi:hypothetical protein EVJ58_g10411 [Rhodofomes roseus]|uniref:tRNA-guanine(15) transglycosylase-like domain-containing protein n=1 Tax=Rhodofomes roseus TaxID=34475 RepID=A0A4Y9XPQ6_9APHY|nr:hypothetical protein EVJ58_g10411 [Rhodofomes roseus]